MTTRYILRNGKPMPEPDLMVWGLWMEHHQEERSVAYTEHGDVSVSTVFLGLDHNLQPSGDPILFESMCFGGPHDGEMKRYTTRDRALAGHEEMVSRCLPDLHP